jgi:hypothetical protein
LANVDPKNYLENALTKVEPELSSLWSSMAEKFGWDHQISKYVSASASLDHIGLTYPEELEAQVFDSEYGFKKDAPKAAMREWQKTGAKDVKGALYSALSNYLKGSGVIR